MDDMTRYNREAKRRQRQKLVAYMGGVCIGCGRSEDLQIDHTDRTKKTISISRKLSLKNPEVIAELKKCQVLCKLCHEKKNAAEQAGFTHGTMYGWLRKSCKCDLCAQAKQDHQERKNAARRTGVRGPYKTSGRGGTKTQLPQNQSG